MTLSEVTKSKVSTAVREEESSFVSHVSLSSSDSNQEEVAPINPPEPFLQLDDGTYSCGFCAKRYKQLASLSKHLEKNHALVNAVIFSCAGCKKSFDSKFQLTRHNKPDQSLMPRKSNHATSDATARNIRQNLNREIVDLSRKLFYQVCHVS